MSTTLYIVVSKDKDNSTLKPTRDSVKEIMNEGDELQFETLKDDFDLLYQIQPRKKTDFVCLIPNGSEVNKNITTIFKNYEETEDRNEKILYMPLVVLAAGETKGVLNACVWNTNIAEEVGVLTYNLARKQVDTTLYGCYIPFELFFDDSNYNKDLKYYQHFYFLNKVTSNESNIVFGIPKTTLFTDVDLSFSHVSNEEKVKYFKQAREINASEPTV